MIYLEYPDMRLYIYIYIQQLLYRTTKPLFLAIPQQLPKVGPQNHKLPVQPGLLMGSVREWVSHFSESVEFPFERSWLFVNYIS